jgi:hypothetical protein
MHPSEGLIGLNCRADPVSFGKHRWLVGLRSLRNLFIQGSRPCAPTIEGLEIKRRLPSNGFGGADGHCRIAVEIEFVLTSLTAWPVTPAISISGREGEHRMADRAIDLDCGSLSTTLTEIGRVLISAKRGRKPNAGRRRIYR